MMKEIDEEFGGRFWIYKGMQYPEDSGWLDVTFPTLQSANRWIDGHIDDRPTDFILFHVVKHYGTYRRKK